jgi:hypothetical protein
MPIPSGSLDAFITYSEILGDTILDLANTLHLLPGVIKAIVCCLQTKKAFF